MFLDFLIFCGHAGEKGKNLVLLRKKMRELHSFFKKILVPNAKRIGAYIANYSKLLQILRDISGIFFPKIVDTKVIVNQNNNFQFGDFTVCLL